MIESQSTEEGYYNPSRRYMDCASPDFDPKRAEALAEEVEGGMTHLGTLPVAVRRNAYGRQLGSFSAHGEFSGTARRRSSVRRSRGTTATSSPSSCRSG